VRIGICSDNTRPRPEPLAPGDEAQTAAEMPTRSGSDGIAVVQAVAVIMGVVVVGLTFLFGH
jgi:hypothetical protein